jgi:hypothetical protein
MAATDSQHAKMEQLRSGVLYAVRVIPNYRNTRNDIGRGVFCVVRAEVI